MLLPGNQLVQALCRTLFYSLWQGLAVAVLAGIIIVCTKKYKPVVRYSIFTGLLFAFVITSAITFWYQFANISAANAAASVLQPAYIETTTTNAIIVQPAPATVTGPASVASNVFGWFTAHANSIVIGWLAIIAMRCIQLFAGFKKVYTLKRKGVTPASEYWHKRMQQLAISINVKAKVTLLQSVLAKVPMVIGHFKPIILLPAGVFTALPQDEIEAILLHELAHIRRKDYLVNMLQHFCEILFFFNPAVLWLSSLIRDERENCCDDIALNQVKNKKQFIHALISFQEYNMAASNYAIGFPGRKDHLLNRVKRIITNNNKTLTNMEKTILATALVLVSFVTLAIAQTKKNPPAKKGRAVEQTDKKPANSNAQHDAVANSNDDNNVNGGGIQDTIPANKGEKQNHSTSNISTTIDGKKYKLVEEDGKLLEFYADGERIPADKLSQYNDIIETIHRQMTEFAQQQHQFTLQQNQFMQTQEAFKKQQELFTQQQQLFSKQADSLHSQQWKKQQEQFQEAQKMFLQQQELFNRQQEEFRKQMDSGKLYIYTNPVRINIPVSPVTVIASHINISPAITTTAKTNVNVPAPVTVTAPVVNASSVKINPVTTINTPIAVSTAVTVTSPAIQVSPAVYVAPVTVVAPIAPTSNKIINSIISYLKNENITIVEDDVNFKLDADEFVLNGVKQPNALHTKLKAKYLKGPKDHVKYTADKNTMHTDIYIENNN